MGNNDIKVKDLSDTSSITTDNQIMVLTNDANNTVQNITVENLLTNIKSSNANNALSIGTDKKLYTPDLSGNIGNLTNLITTNKSSLVAAVNEVKGDTNAISDELIPAAKGWLEEGEIYQKADWYGEKLYNDVYHYNHSTFDLSKFTKVGSPIITDDGIASGFSFNDYFTSSFIPSSSMTSFDFIIGFTTGNDVTTSQAILGQVTTNRHTPQIEVLNGKVRGVFALNSSTWGTISGELSVQPNTHYVIKFSWSNQIIKSFQLVNGAWVQFGQDTAQATVLWDEVMKIGSDQISAIFLGSIDLKEFSIFVNGYPAFMGNKTGIDTIKPADFTAIVNGVSTVNPTLPITGAYLNITADGIASGFNSGNYIRTTSGVNFSTASSWEFISPKFKTSINSNRVQYVCVRDLTSSNAGCIYTAILLTGVINMVCVDTNWSGSKYSSNNTKVINPNNWYQTRIKFTGTQYEFYYKENDGEWISYGVVSGSTISLNASYLDIGQTSNNYWFDGSIDLNAFKVYVDGNLVYQPCLLIPYNESSTGSKIVDVAYRDRVQDVYEQYGSANYYTIDEVNENCTLPMGEIYGFIRQSDSDKIYKDLVPCYDSTKAISVPLLGNYTAPADGYVCSPNMVLVLDPDNGYENFSLTIMRNTQSMTMISCTGPTAFPFCLSVLKDDVLTVAADATVTSNVYFIPREGV